jgi:hypothetical protein
MKTTENIDLELQIKIDNYLLNKLTPIERADFEELLELNPEIKQKVETQKLICDELKYRTSFNAILNDVKKEDKKRIVFRRILTTTWSAAAIFIGVFFVNSTIQNSRMDGLYTEMYAAPQEGASRGESDVQGDSEEKEFLAATKLLADKLPEQALIALQKLYSYPVGYRYYEEVRWYLVLTELKLHHKSEAKKYLNELLDSEYYHDKAKKALEVL